MFQVATLFIYPIKSCAGVSVPRWPITGYGFEHDREFLVTDEQGNFLTQRTHPQLALLTPFLESEVLRLRGSTLPEITIPWFGSPTDSAIQPRRWVSIWKDRVEADDMGEEAAAWFSSHLGFSARLVRLGRAYRRMIQEEKIPAVHRQVLGVRETGFADAYPFLIISEASLVDLNRRLLQPMPMNRFRPNIVVSGSLDPYAEDGWELVEIGSMRFRHGGRCVRCIITTTDQTTLERSKEPLRTLATYRRNGEGGVNFGVNFFCESLTGTVQVGDAVRVIQPAPNDPSHGQPAKDR
jgi:uncharacterized protein YcbX